MPEAFPKLALVGVVIPDRGETGTMGEAGGAPAGMRPISRYRDVDDVGMGEPVVGDMRDDGVGDTGNVNWLSD